MSEIYGAVFEGDDDESSPITFIRGTGVTLESLAIEAILKPFLIS